MHSEEALSLKFHLYIYTFMQYFYNRGYLSLDILVATFDLSMYALYFNYCYYYV